MVKKVFLAPLIIPAGLVVGYGLGLAIDFFYQRLDKRIYDWGTDV